MRRLWGSSVILGNSWGPASSSENGRIDDSAGAPIWPPSQVFPTAQDESIREPPCHAETHLFSPFLQLCRLLRRRPPFLVPFVPFVPSLPQGPRGCASKSRSLPSSPPPGAKFRWRFGVGFSFECDRVPSSSSPVASPPREKQGNHIPYYLLDRERDSSSRGVLLPSNRSPWQQD